ncbi:40-residue YVTN family beta-propeller repeat-containing protein, partial [mine drainage metagenome]
MPAGHWTVLAINGGTFYGPRLDVGGSPSSVAVDSRDGRVFVGDTSSDAIDIVGAANFTEIDQVNLSSHPTSLAVDAAVDRLYVALPATDNISVLNASSGAFVTNISLPWSPTSIAVAPNASLLFAASSSANDVAEIAVGNDTVQTTAPVGSEPRGVAYDPSLHQLWVANVGSWNLSVLDVPNLTLARTVPLDFPPSAMLFDPVQNETLVGSILTHRLGFYSAINGTEVANVTLPAQNYGAIAFDPSASEAFVSIGDSNVAVVSTATDALLTNSPSSSSLAGLAYDPTTGYVVAALTGSGDIARVSPAVFASAPLRIEPSLLAPGPLESGLSGSVSATGFGANSTVARFTRGRHPGSVHVGDGRLVRRRDARDRRQRLA